MPSVTTPTQLGRYEVLRVLGQGAMGVVYEAHDPVLERKVAVKTLSLPLLSEPGLREEYLARFRREAQAAARLAHPNVVAVHDAGVDPESGAPFLVMERVEGLPLSTLLREHGALPLQQALELVAQVAAALDAAHRAGIVHRDIKPGNVLLDARGAARVTDFGIARLEGSELTGTGVSLGTPGFLAPELLRGGRADARSDLFALGALAYALLTGRRAFDGPTPHAAGMAVLQDEPAPPAALDPRIPEPASRAVMAALAKSPEARPPSAAAFLELWRGAAAPATAGVTGARRAGDRAEPVRGEASAPAAAPQRRRRRLALALGLLMAAIVAVALWALRTPAPAPAGRGATQAGPAEAAVAGSAPAARAPAAAATRTPAAPREQQAEAAAPNAASGDGKEPTAEPAMGKARGKDRGKRGGPGKGRGPEKREKNR
jgi:predicted Ser/Thr protein kinase